MIAHKGFMALVEGWPEPSVGNNMLGNNTYAPRSLPGQFSLVDTF